MISNKDPTWPNSWLCIYIYIYILECVIWIHLDPFGRLTTAYQRFSPEDSFPSQISRSKQCRPVLAELGERLLCTSPTSLAAWHGWGLDNWMGNSWGNSRQMYEVGYHYVTRWLELSQSWRLVRHTVEVDRAEVDNVMMTRPSDRYTGHVQHARTLPFQTA